MKKILFILFVFITTISQAQLSVGNVTLDFGEDISNTEGNIVRIAGIKNDIIYTLSKKNNKFFIQTFDAATKNNLKSKSLKLEKIEDSKVVIEDVVVIENKAYVMASYYNKSKKQNTFVALEVSEDLELSSPKKLLAIGVKNRTKKGAFLFEMSYDEINYMVTHINIIEKKELLTYEFTLLDQNMDAVKKEKHSINFQDRKDLYFDFADFGVNEKGDAFIIYTESYRDKKNKTTKNTITLHTFYSDNEYQKEEIIVDLKGKRVVNCDLIYTNDKLQLIGFYSKLKKSGRSEYKIEGIFDIAINTLDNTVEKKVFNDFTLETKTKLIGKRRAKKGKNLLPFYSNTHLIERSNGGVIVLSEFFVATQGRSSGIGIGGFGVTATPIIYDNNEIIVTALNADGTFAWSNVIPKEQRLGISVISVGFAGGISNGSVSMSAGVMFPVASLGDGPEYLSSMPFYKDGKLTVIINDDPKNIGITDIDDVKRVKNINKMIPVAFEFDDASGNMTRVDPEEFEKRQIVVRPGVTYQLNSNETIIYGSSKSETKLGVLKLDE